MQQKVRGPALAGCLILQAFLPTPLVAQPLPTIHVAIIADGPWERNEEIRALFEKEIVDLTEGEFDVRFPRDKPMESDWTLTGVKRDLDRLLEDPDVDIVVALGVLVSNEVSHRKNLGKPVIAPIVLDAALQGLPQPGGRSGVKNLNYLVCPNQISRDIEAFLTVVPFKRIAIVLNKRIRDAIEDLVPSTQALLQTLDVTPTIISVDKSVDEVFTQLPSDIEAVYVAPLLHLPPGEFDRLVAGLIERRLPSFSLLGTDEVERGLLASLNTNFLPRLARRVALNVQRILLGEEAGSLPTVFAPGEQLTINMATARAIGVFPSWGVITDAVLINESREDIDRVISIEDVAREAVQFNLDLRAKQESILAGEQEIGIARSELLPGIDLSVRGLQIDADRAEHSAGQQSERTLSGTIGVRQVLFAEPAWANLSIQKRRQRAREYDRDALRLDVVQDAVTAYLDVLRAKTFERIQRDNLERTRADLELARVREAIGAARAAEVLRWESEIANNRKAVIEANSRRNIAEIALNRLLHRPAEEHFSTREVDMNDANLILTGGGLLKYMGNPWDFKQLRRFMVKEGIDNTPEIRALEQAVAAEERALKSATRSYWLPNLALEAQLTNVLSRGGAGSDFSETSLPSPLSNIFAPPEDVSWSVGISLNYPVFDGAGKYARRSKEKSALAELRLQLTSTTELVEQRIRSAFHKMGASYAGIEQADLAAGAARQSLELTEDAYSKGAATILDLLDAQNNALVAEEIAANSVYDFLIDLMEAERSVGRLYIDMTDPERAAFLERMEAFFAESDD